MGTMARTARLLATLAAAGLGAGAGAFAGARHISGPQRPALDYGYTPFEIGVDAEAVRFRASDGVGLAGWWFEVPGSQRVVICCHGHRGSKADMLGIGPGLFRAGNSVFVFDFRGNGESDDGPQSLAHYERRDLQAAVDWVAARRPDAEIDLVGFSMGAAVTLLVAAEDDRVAKVVADSPFADMRSVVAAAVTGLRLPPVPFVDLVNHATRLRYGYAFQEVQPIASVGRIAPRPLLLIHGAHDAVIPVEHARRLAEAAGPSAALWIVPGVGHCGGYFADRPGYLARVAGFLAGGPQDAAQ